MSYLRSTGLLRLYTASEKPHTRQKVKKNPTNGSLVASSSPFDNTVPYSFAKSYQRQLVDVFQVRTVH